MRLVAPPVLDTTPLEALRVSLRAWLVDTLVWLVTALAPLRRNAPAWLKQLIAAAERELDADLRATAQDLRRLLIAHAYARLALPAPPRGGKWRPLSVRRRAQTGAFIRKCTATALKRLHAGSLQQRAERLRDMLDNPEPLIAETCAHMRRMFLSPRLPGVLVRITHAHIRCVAHAQAPRAADTS